MGLHEKGAGRKAPPGQGRPVSRAFRENGRRPWIVFGPGLALALLAALFIFWSRRTERGAGPGFQPAGQPWQSQIPRPAPAPELAFVLRNAGALALSKPQIQKLEKLERQFEQETAGTRAELARASGEFAREMRDRGGRGVSLADLQERASAVRALSRQLATARRFYWTRAAQILTPAERARAEALWARQPFGVRKHASAFSPAEQVSIRQSQSHEHFSLPDRPALSPRPAGRPS